MTECPSCGHENPEGQKFCGECAAPLGTPARPVAEERKVVTCLFCDLVGFTASSESADPEDVDQMLTAYSEMARARIESHGGVVEKFIGDAVVGIFGVPAAHEDDPERAVRAGIRIVEGAEELESIGGEPLRLRVGINTGEALVRLGVISGSGERILSGDAINTASRLQSVAPEMGVAVGLGTYEATAAVFDYEELEPATLKGKAEPVRVFHAKAPLARFGTDLTRTHDTPFIGREIDLSLLKGIFDKAVAAESVQLVTVVGEPGLGKSRIVAELGDYVDALPGLITWRQGRCLPYGDGITFWALGEILKAHAGILESDPPDVATNKLEAVLPEGSERRWFRERLLPLLGIEASSSAGREELFTAWRRFLEHVAEQDPTVLVFEDLHWADDAMLAFLEHLADRAEAVPLLVIGTARPELFERHPDYAVGMRNVNTISLAPLSEEETARLLFALLEATVLPAELQQPILDRAEGNPLYAEEFVRLLRDKDLLIQKGSTWAFREGAEVPFPDTVQALIAARLDTLGTEAKSMLADAAVIGKVFWAGALAQMGERDLAEVLETLRELSRKELVRAVRRSSLEGEAEYAFWHILARDVTYSQLPRASRASRHVAAARWIESKAPERVEDLADVLAYHYSMALELARAAGQTERAEELAAPALQFLSLAGERALGLDNDAALSNYERALALTPIGHPARAGMLRQFGEVAYLAARFAESAEALEEAVRLLRARGDVLAAAEALRYLASHPLEAMNDPRRFKDFDEALTMLEGMPAGPHLVEALAEASAKAILADGDLNVGLTLADRALGLARDLRLPVPARALGFRAMARCTRGDPKGLQDFRDALSIAIDAGDGVNAALLYNNLGVSILDYEGPQVALEILHEGLRFAEARGLQRHAIGLATSRLDPLVCAGEFEEALRSASALAVRAEAAGDESDLAWVMGVRACAASLCGRADEVAPHLERLEAGVRLTGRADYLVLGLGGAALARSALGAREQAAALLREVQAAPNIEGSDSLAWYLPMLVRTALSIGQPDLAVGLVARLIPRLPYADRALVASNAALAEERGDLVAAVDAYVDAADRWEQFGVVPEQGFALLGQARCLLRLARPTEAAPVLRHAREIFARLHATPALAETDALLQQSTALSS